MILLELVVELCGI